MNDFSEIENDLRKLRPRSPSSQLIERVEAGIGAADAERKIIRPRDHAHPEYVIIFKFDGYTHLKAWTTSPVRKAWLKKISKVAVDPFKEQVLTGLETWFTSPVQPGAATPPRGKVGVRTTSVV